MRSRSLQVVLGVLLAVPGGCRSARGDDFSRFKEREVLEHAGEGGKKKLRYRLPGGTVTTYTLDARRTVSRPKQTGKLRLQLGFAVPASVTGAGPFELQLQLLHKLWPEPPGGVPDLAPNHVLLKGSLGARGQLAEVDQTDDLHPPVNLALLIPLVLPRLPREPVGAGARWRAASRFRWQRRQQADPLLGQPGYGSLTELLMSASYRLTSLKPDRAEITAELKLRLRSRTTALGHKTSHEGRGKVTASYVLDLATGLPVQARTKLEAHYTQRANDKKHQIREQLAVTLDRAPSAGP